MGFDDFLRQLAGHFVVSLECESEGASCLGHGAQIIGIAEQFKEIMKGYREEESFYAMAFFLAERNAINVAAT